MRYNIFNKAHLPLKTAMLSGCISISESIEGKISASGALQKVEEVLDIFNEQVTYEALYVLPLIFEYEPSIWNNYTSEHNKATKLITNLKELVQLYYKQKKKADKLKILTLLGQSYNECMLFNFNHMDDEEAVLNEILWRYYPDSILIQIEENMDILPHLVKQTVERTGFQIATAA